METIEVSTTVHVPPAEAYAFLRDFEGYSAFSKYITEIESRGQGGEGTEYVIRFGWWRLSIGIRTMVTEEVPPERIDWRVVSEIDAHGSWTVTENEDDPGSSDVSLTVTYDPDSAERIGLDIPALVSLDWVIDRVIGLIEEEGKRVVERVVRRLEGEPRRVTLRVTHRSGETE